MLSLFLASALASPTLEVSGPCPGPVTVDVSGLPPDGRHVVFASPNVGPFSVGSGACAGTDVGLQPPFFLLASPAADGSGARTYTPTLDPSACGWSVQILDLADCSLSTVEPITPAAPVDTWSVEVDPPVVFRGSALAAHPDGSIDVAFGQGGTTWVYKFDPDGALLRSFEVPELFEVEEALLLAGGDLVLVGKEFADFPALARIDQATDEVLYSRVMEHAQGFYSVAQLNDGNLVATSIYTGIYDPDTGDVLSYRRQVDRGREYGVSAAQDGSYFVASNDDDDAFAPNYLHVKKVSADGVVEWGRILEHGTGSSAEDAETTVDGDVVVIGNTDSLCHVTRLSPDGVHRYTHIVGAPEGFYCQSAAPTPDNGVVIVGEVDSIEDRDRAIVKVDVDGNVVWARRYDQGPTEDVIAMPTGGYAMLGSLLTGVLYRMDADGRTGCELDLVLTAEPVDVSAIDWFIDDDTDQGTHLTSGGTTPLDETALGTCPL